MGFNISTFGTNGVLGVAIPIKRKYFLEFSYEYNINKFKYSSFKEEGVSRYQLSLYIPLTFSYEKQKVYPKNQIEQENSKYIF